MNNDSISYIVFAVVLLLALIFDLGLMSKKDKTVTIRQALYQTFFWVTLALAFFVFVWMQNGQTLAIQYLSGYLMEWSLSIDNIFVFILIFTAFSVKEKYYGRVLLLGILMAIIFRIIFISVGVSLVETYQWVLLVFGAFLLYTGYKMFTSNEEEAFDPYESKVYKILKKWLPLTKGDGDGKFVIRKEGKPLYTSLFVVVVMLAAIDLVFALDSIPAVMGISNDRMVIYTSNIFAVLGLRSLFFLLRGAVSKFDYLQQGIAIVLIFIGVKMLGEHWISQWIDKQTMVFISLAMIVVCISGSVFYSIFISKKGMPVDIEDDSVN